MLYVEDVQCDELETFLETLLDQEFDTIVEDGSTPEVGHVVYHVIIKTPGMFLVLVVFFQVSRKICDLYRNCHTGNKESLQTFLASHHLPPPPSPDTTDGESSKMEEGESAGGGEVLMEEEEEGKEEGWEVVRRQRRRSKQ